MTGFALTPGGTLAVQDGGHLAGQSMCWALTVSVAHLW